MKYRVLRATTVQKGRYRYYILDTSLAGTCSVESHPSWSFLARERFQIPGKILECGFPQRKPIEFEYESQALDFAGVLNYASILREEGEWGVLRAKISRDPLIIDIEEEYKRQQEINDEIRSGE